MMPFAGSESLTDEQSAAAFSDGSRRLWSLREMMKVYAHEYIVLGLNLEDAMLVFAFTEADAENRPLNDGEIGHLREQLTKARDICDKLDLPVSLKLVDGKLKNGLPQTQEALRVLIDAVMAELETKLFLFVPTNRAKYYDLVMPIIIATQFPFACRELVLAGNAFAAELYTASVFHSMRAAEIGVQALGRSLNVTFSFDIEFAEFGKIVGEIDQKIREIRQQPRSHDREDSLVFYSEAASQFRYFNLGWRVRGAHARGSFDEDQAKRVLEHSIDFFRTLSSHLSEEGILT